MKDCILIGLDFDSISESDSYAHLLELDEAVDCISIGTLIVRDEWSHDKCLLIDASNPVGLLLNLEKRLGELSAEDADNASITDMNQAYDLVIAALPDNVVRIWDRRFGEDRSVDVSRSKLHAGLQKCGSQVLTIISRFMPNVVSSDYWESLSTLLQDI